MGNSCIEGKRKKSIFMKVGCSINKKCNLAIFQAHLSLALRLVSLLVPFKTQHIQFMILQSTVHTGRGLQANFFQSRKIENLQNFRD